MQAGAGGVSGTAQSAPTPGGAGSGVALLTAADVPADPFADLRPRSDLSHSTLWLRFYDTHDEQLFSVLQWKLRRVTVYVTWLLLLGFTCAFSFEYELDNIINQPALLLIVFLMRLLPLFLLLIFSCLRPTLVVRWWSPAAAVTLFLLATSVQLHHHLCRHATFLPAAPDCLVFRAGAAIPWLTIVMIGLLPPIAVLGFAVRWLDVVVFSVASFGTYIGLTLVWVSSKSVSTSVLIFLLSTLVSALGAYYHERELRVAYHRESAVRRKLNSLLSTAVPKRVALEQNQRLNEVLKRMDLMLLEVNGDGIVQWVSPSCRSMLSVEPDELLQTELYRNVHADDVTLVRDAVRKLVANGAQVAAAASALVSGSRGQAANAAALASYTSPEVQVHSRVSYRRKRDRDTGMWVEAELYAIVRRPLMIPGVATPAPAGETTVLVVERDASYDRRRGLMGTTAAGGPAGSGGPSPAGGGPQPLVSGAMSGQQTGAASTGMENASTLSTSNVMLSTGASGTGSSGGGAFGPMPMYDPYFERTLYTVLAALYLPLSAARASAASCTATLPKALEDKLAAGDSKTGDAAAPATSSSHTNAAPPPSVQERVFVQHGPDSRPSPTTTLLQIVDSYMRAAQAGVTDALGVSRYRCQHMPVRPVSSVDLRAMISDCVEVGKLRLQSRDVTLSLVIDERVPAIVLADRFKSQLLMDLAIATATSVARAGEITVTVQVGSATPATLSPTSNTGDSGTGSNPSTPPQAVDSVLRYAVSFDATPVGGVDAIATALAADPLLADALFSPAPKSSVEPAEKAAHAYDSFDQFLTYQALLPLLRHTTLCVGGVISAGTGGPVSGSASGDASAEHTIILVVDMPLRAGARPLLAGPSAVDMSLARTLINGAPVDYIPALAPVPPPPVTTVSQGSSTAAVVSGGVGGGVTPVNAQQAAAARAAAGAAAAPLQAAGAAAAFKGAPPAVGVPGGVEVAGRAPAGSEEAPVAVSGVVPAPIIATPAAAAVRPSRIMETEGMRVLFVDDDPVNRRFGSRMLARLGATFVLLEDGDQVMGALQETREPFDAILLDIMMQRTDGAVVCQELRESGISLPIIAMTGTATVRDVQRFHAAGFDLVLPKPFDINAIGRALIEGRARRTRVNQQAADDGSASGLPPVVTAGAAPTVGPNVG